MIQRQKTHPKGTFSHHAACGAEPRHFICQGATSREPARPMQGGYGERHALECCACGTRTALHATLDRAVAEWGELHGQLHLALAEGGAKVTRLPRRRA